MICPVMKKSVITSISWARNVLTIWDSFSGRRRWTKGKRETRAIVDESTCIMWRLVCPRSILYNLFAFFLPLLGYPNHYASSERNCGYASAGENSEFWRTLRRESLTLRLFPWMHGSHDVCDEKYASWNTVSTEQNVERGRTGNGNQDCVQCSAQVVYMPRRRKARVSLPNRGWWT